MQQFDPETGEVTFDYRERKVSLRNQDGQMVTIPIDEYNKLKNMQLAKPEKKKKGKKKRRDRYEEPEPVR